MLKAEVFKVGIPEKGTLQGGILSPLLANLVLNELDWWLESKSSKGIRFVRYADDVKILCPTYSIARNMLDKTTKWLNKRLSLEVSEDKTKIINMKKNYSYFLGLKFKIKSHKKNEDLHLLYWHTSIYVRNKLKNVLKISSSSNNLKNGKNEIIPFIRGKPLMEIGKVTHEPPRYKGNKINYFEINSRKRFHKKLSLENQYILDWLLKMPMKYESVEFNDNILSKFCGQLGKYAITNKLILDINNIKIVKKI